MEVKYFLTQVTRANGTYEKGCVVKDSLNEARQSYHAYLGAYGYGNDATVDYVFVSIASDAGLVTDWCVDDRRAQA